MKRNITEPIVLQAILNEVLNKLGDKYKFQTNYLIIDKSKESTGGEEEEEEEDEYLIAENHPDIVIRDTNSKRKIYIEIKGSTQDDDLPLAIIPILRKIKKRSDFKPNSDNIILVSLSDVSTGINDYLKKDNIRVVKVDEDDEYLDQLLQIIKEK
jgi:hypothetical protein